MVKTFKLVDACGSSGNHTLSNASFEDGGDDLASQTLEFRFSTSDKQQPLVGCRLSGFDKPDRVKKFKKRLMQGLIVADLEGGGKIYVDQVQQGMLICSRTPPAHAPQPPPQTGAHAAPPQTMPQMQQQHQYQQEQAYQHYHQQYHHHQQQQHAHQQQHAYQQYQQQHQQQQATLDVPAASYHQQQQPAYQQQFQGGGAGSSAAGSSSAAGGSNAAGGSLLQHSQGTAAWPDEAAADAAGDAKRPRKIEGVYGSDQHGTAGKPLHVYTNFFPVRVKPTLRVSQYDVKLLTRDGAEVLKAETRRRILNEMPVHLLAPPTTGCAYDGNNILYVADAELELNARAASAGWAQDGQDLVYTPPPAGPEGGGGGSSSRGARKFGGTLTIKRAQGFTVDFQHFMTAAGGNPARAQMMVLDVVFKAQATSRCKMIGDAFYDATIGRTARPWAERLPIGSGLNQLWLGYRTNTVYTEQGPMLQIDRAASCMLMPVSLQEFIAKRLSRDPRQLELTGRGETARLSGFPIAEINKKLTEGTRNLKVSSEHRMSPDGRQAMMDYVVRGLDTCRCDEAHFQEVCGSCARCADQTISKKAPVEERCERPTSTTVARWFAREFPRFPLRRLDLPCVLAGSQKEPWRCKLPLELLNILPGQPVQESGPEVLEAMIKQTAVAPQQRFPKLIDIVKAEYASGNEARLSENFGMTVVPESVGTTARVLTPCKLRYGNGRDFTPDFKGSWNLRNCSFVDPINTSWAMVECFNPEQERGLQHRDFIRTLQGVSAERNMRLGEPVGSDPIRAYRVIQQAAARPKDGLFEKFLTEEVQRLEQGSGRKIGLLLAVMGDKKGENGGYVYPALKRWSHTISGIPVQSCQVSKALKTGGKGRMAADAQYAAGLLLKMNLKLGGENCYAITPERVGREQGLALMLQVPEGTMVVGLDVHHAAPGSQGASYAAVVASLDPHCVKMRTVVTTQEMMDDPNGGSRKQRQEIVGTLYETMVSLLHEFCAADYFGNGSRPPKRIIFFRDGVAHNQFEAVAEQEIEAVTNACRHITGGMPIQLVFIVTQMRTRARIAQHPRGPGQLENAPCGTVVDRDIVDAGTFEWYAQPHHVLNPKSSARLSHYHVLVNDARLTPDELQRFAFDLCHLYQRATKIVSRPAHLYYAHLAAALGPYYESAFKEGNADYWDMQSTGSHGSGSSGSSRRDLHPAMKGKVYFA